jgi:hypothetical protein
MSLFIKDRLDYLTKKENEISKEKKLESKKLLIKNLCDKPDTMFYNLALSAVLNSGKFKDKYIRRIVKIGILQVSEGKRVFKRNDLSFDNMCNLKEELEYIKPISVHTKKEMTLYIKKDFEINEHITTLESKYPDLSRETIAHEINKLLIKVPIDIISGSLKLSFRLLESYI